jgi:ribonuclease HI
MIIASKPIFPRKKYCLKKPREEIIAEQKVKDIHQRITFGKTNQLKKKEVKTPPEIKSYEFNVYTDGGYSNIYRVGSWSYFIKVKDGKKHFTFDKGAGSEDVHDRLPILMELIAVIRAIQSIVSKNNMARYGYTIKSITIHSDNRQVVNSNVMVKHYEENDWFYLRKGYEMTDQLKNAWKELYALNKAYNVKYVWVRGHSGNLGNERCNKVCSTRLGQKIKVKRIIKYNMELL